ncbi:hypothetical protein [Kribbella shirazensis]|uniref:Uncharacterized protein n=1 Tax=Kribbella shirazensis TaxID=1105143 RepID=A0A7X6A1H3_9ACTN|nr:hypothetical protein [Kribbella shirazensis]NIK58247.1 hypothetical protein [Kribbella shirazensis]
MQAEWLSQTFPPEGASAAEGIRNQLGRPELDLLTILVREAAQNSWDARRSDAQVVDFRLSIGSVSAANSSAWRDLLLRNAPIDAHLPLRRILQKSDIRTLTVSDRGTTGLGGPTRADTIQGGNHDFVAFVRNIGEPRDKELGGGTYGFGKGIFYLLSSAGTVLLHTRCDDGTGRLQTRLIGCALWKSYVGADGTGERRYTGRHWWGDVTSGIVEPLVDDAAAEMARRLGLEPFEDDETGTDVVIFDPELDDRDTEEVAQYLAETVAWQLWPKMLRRIDGRPPMRFAVRHNGRDVVVPDPETTRPLDLFVAAYRQLDSEGGRELECRSPKKLLGRLGLVKTVAPALTPTPAGLTAGVDTLVHHVCLMRPAELVVTYRPGPKPPSELLAYAGVFRADPAMDDVYARAEPPTHDSWNPQSLQAPQNTFVRTTFLRIKEALEGLLELGGTARGGSAALALGAASSHFASLVAGAEGLGGATDFTSARGRDTTGKGGRHRKGDPRPVRTSSIEYVDDPRVELLDGKTVVVQAFRLPMDGGHDVTADVAVLAGAGSRETDPPVGADQPVVMGWRSDDGRFVGDRSPRLEGGDGTVWSVLVRPALDTMTEVVITSRSDVES